MNSKIDSFYVDNVPMVRCVLVDSALMKKNYKDILKLCRVFKVLFYKNGSLKHVFKHGFTKDRVMPKINAQALSKVLQRLKGNVWTEKGLKKKLGCVGVTDLSDLRPFYLPEI